MSSYSDCVIISIQVYKWWSLHWSSAYLCKPVLLLIIAFFTVPCNIMPGFLPWYSNLKPGLFCEWSLWKYTVVSWEVVRRGEGISWPLNRPITALVSRGPLRISRKSWLASVEKLRNWMWAPGKKEKEDTKMKEQYYCLFYNTSTSFHIQIKLTGCINVLIPQQRLPFGITSINIQLQRSVTIGHLPDCIHNSKGHSTIKPYNSIIKGS